MVYKTFDTEKHGDCVAENEKYASFILITQLVIWSNYVRLMVQWHRWCGETFHMELRHPA